LTNIILSMLTMNFLSPLLIKLTKEISINTVLITLININLNNYDPH